MTNFYNKNNKIYIVTKNERIKFDKDKIDNFEVKNSLELIDSFILGSTLYEKIRNKDGWITYIKEGKEISMRAYVKAKEIKKGEI